MIKAKELVININNSSVTIDSEINQEIESLAEMTHLESDG